MCRGINVLYEPKRLEILVKLDSVGVFDAQYLKRRRLVRGGAFSMFEQNLNLTLTFKRSKSAILLGLQNFDQYYLENGTR